MSQTLLANRCRGDPRVVALGAHTGAPLQERMDSWIRQQHLSQQSTDGAPTNNPYTTPATMLIIGLLFAGSGTALFHNPVVQLIIGLGALLLILGAAVLAVRRMQREQNR